MSTLMEHMENKMNDIANMSVTENGAIGYNTTGTVLLDMNFKIPSMRKAVVKGNEIEVQQVIDQFDEALEADANIAVKWLFYLRDVRGGLGERKIFRVLFQHLIMTKPRQAMHLLKQVPFYGRWDDVLYLLDRMAPGVTIRQGQVLGYIKKNVVELVQKQLVMDVSNMKIESSISLMAKWMPSITSEHYNVREKAKLLARGMKISHKDYRVIMSALRSYLKIVEKKMSSDEWGEIEYSQVPSRAIILYNKAFKRHDGARFQEYLDSLKKGETKINASTLYPHEIVHKYKEVMNFGDGIDTVLEELWKALPEKFGEKEPKIMVVRDGSGSMKMRKLAASDCCAMDVGTALAIYFAERLPGEFRNKFITFSHIPRMVDLSQCETLVDKLRVTYKNTDMENTDIEAVFELMLYEAVENKMTQEDFPDSILILSDMEFDASVESHSTSRRHYDKLFDDFKKKYEDHGYKLPKIIFWNVGSDTDTIPMKENELGVMLVSGYSLNTLQAVLSEKNDPFEVLLEILMGERYQTVYLEHLDSDDLEEDLEDELNPEVKKADDFTKAINKLMYGSK